MTFDHFCNKNNDLLVGNFGRIVAILDISWTKIHRCLTTLGANFTSGFKPWSGPGLNLAW